MNDPTSPIGWSVWRRGAQVGLWLLGLFVVATIVIFVLLGALGWRGVAQAMCAMFVGPVLALAVLVGWWVVRRPRLSDWLRPAVSRPPESMAGDVGEDG